MFPVSISAVQTWRWGRYSTTHWMLLRNIDQIFSCEHCSKTDGSAWNRQEHDGIIQCGKENDGAWKDIPADGLARGDPVRHSIVLVSLVNRRGHKPLIVCKTLPPALQSVQTWINCPIARRMAQHSNREDISVQIRVTSPQIPNVWTHQRTCRWLRSTRMTHGGAAGRSVWRADWMEQIWKSGWNPSLLSWPKPNSP